MQEPDFWTFSTADLFDFDPTQVSVCDQAFRSFGRAGSITGPISTVRLHDHNAVREVLAEPGLNRILVVDQIVQEPRVAVFGDGLALLARENGWAGLIINGSIRDSERLKSFELAIFAVSTTARRATSGSAEWERNVRLAFGGTEFLPNAWVVADQDAIVCCPENVIRTFLRSADMSFFPSRPRE